MSLVMRILRGLSAGAGIAVLGVVLGLALVEGGMRVYEYLRPPAGKGFFWVPSTAYGWGLAPGRSAPYFNDAGEFRTFVEINSLGLRDVEHSYRKPANVFRILILGDSYMEALQVDEREMFARLLEAELNRGHPAKAIEVINTGVSAWGTDNELLFLREEGFKYEADLVLLSFTTANDIRENYLAFNMMAIGANVTKPHFSLDANGRLEKHPPAQAPAPPIPWWREHLRVGAYLHNRLVPGSLPGPQANIGSFPPADPKIPYVPADILVYDPDPPAQVKQAYAVTEALLLALRDEVASRGAKFGVMLHNGPWVYDDARWRLMCARNPMALNGWDRQKPNREIGQFLAQNGIAYVDLFQAFDAAKDREELFFKIDPHWRPAGHRIAATEAAKFLRAQSLVP